MCKCLLNNSEYSFLPSQMFRFIRSRLHRTANIIGKDSTALSFFLLLQRNPSCLKPLSTIPSNIPAGTQTPTSSFTVSYLINSCGLSRQSAIPVSSQIRLESAENPDSVLTFFRNYGFTETQIRNIIVKRPRYLLANPEKSLLPKLQYFQDLGISGQILTKVFSSIPVLFSRSLHNQIIPYVDFIKTFVQSNEDIVVNIQRMCRFLQLDFRKRMESNIKILRKHHVPEFLITKLIARNPTAFMSPSVRFSEISNMVKEAGFDPSTGNFILAIHILSAVGKPKWEDKIDVFRSLGWSQDELFSAFRAQPYIMGTSKKKIMRVMNFFINEMGWKPSDLAKYPGILLFSFEKRIIPRCSVMQILLSKGIVEKHSTVLRSLQLSDKAFSENFIVKHQDCIPEILTMYQVKMGSSKSEESTAQKL